MLADKELDNAVELPTENEAPPKINVHTSNGRKAGILIRRSSTVDKNRSTVAYIAPTERGKYHDLYHLYAEAIEAYYERNSQRPATVGGRIQADSGSPESGGTVDSGKDGGRAFGYPAPVNKVDG